MTHNYRGIRAGAFWVLLFWLDARVRTHDQNFVPLIICYKIVTLHKINVPSC